MAGATTKWSVDADVSDAHTHATTSVYVYTNCCASHTQDYLDVIPASVSPPSPPPLSLADNQATTATHKLFSLLVGLFGKQMVAGTQVRENSLAAVEYAFQASGKRPALVEGGLLKYSVCECVSV